MNMLRSRFAGRRPVVASIGVVFISFFLLSLVTACTKGKKGPGQPLSVEVTTVTVSPKDTPVNLEFVGQTESSRQVEIRARVNGFLDKRLYEEGNMVQTGQVMFQMERSPFEAALQEAKGDLAIQQARYTQAKANLERIRPLVGLNAISKKDFDDAVSTEEAARAGVLASQGKVRQAELNLGYTTVRSPVMGLSSRAKKQEGSYVSTGTDSLLTYVAQIDPIWVNFSISENETLKYRDQGARGLLKFPGSDDFTVEVVLADGSVFPNKGRVGFREPAFSSETGTFMVRAIISNPQSILKPGQFVRVNLKGAIRPKAILVPQRAVMQGAKGHFVWVAGKDNKAELRYIVAGDWYGDDWFINGGLRAGDRVVVDGGIRLAPGTSLKIVEPTTGSEKTREESIRMPSSGPASGAAKSTTSIEKTGRSE